MVSEFCLALKVVFWGEDLPTSLVLSLLPFLCRSSEPHPGSAECKFQALFLTRLLLRTAHRDLSSGPKIELLLKRYKN